MQAPRGRQLKIHGNIVNVPTKVTHTASMLPRLPSETGTIKVNLKRKLQYKSSAFCIALRHYEVPLHKKDLFATIRQLGPATLFCSFSSAETQWIHLLQILDELVDHKQYTDNELENLNWEEKCRLIQTDPVTCARHFDYQVNQFLTNFLLSSAKPLETISD